MDQETIKAWQRPARAGERGRPYVYADAAIVCMAMLAAVYGLPLRAAEGLLSSILKQMGVALPAPDYTTLCRRRKNLSLPLPPSAPRGPLHLVVDSTGVKIYGEGEWKVRQHGYTKRRTWRKLHLGVDEATHEVRAAVVTTNAVADAEALPCLLEQVEGEVRQVSGDGAYDTRGCYEEIENLRARAAIPPRRGARIWRHGGRDGERLMRDENLRRIRAVGRAEWKRESGYHRRSLAECAMFRFKTLFGERVRARTFPGQAAEALIRCAALNRMTRLGMPESYAT
jgi:IS5 family transposase